jgi:hypothetical protein
MSETGKRLDDDEAAGFKWRLDVLEGRREESDRFAWAVPALVIAAQAFLLSVGLNPNTQPLGRLVASLAGLITLAATAHLMAKQVYNFDVYEAVIERDRKLLRLPSVQMDALICNPQSFPENTNYRKRNSWKSWRRHLIVSRKAVTVWAWAFILLAVLDLGLAVYSILAWTGHDPGWLSHTTVRFHH